jgi:biopolymer transport protein ExbD
VIKLSSNLKHSQALIDLTPLVDVILLMLVFFIVTSDILPFKSLNVSLPELEVESPVMTSSIGVIMDAQNVIYVGSRKEIVDLTSFYSSLKKEIEKVRARYSIETPTVVLSVDRSVEYGDFLRLFAEAQKAEVPLRLVYNESEEC